MRGAGKPPSPESFEEPAWIHVAPSPLSNVLVHCASNTCALFGLQCFPRDSQRSSSGYVTPHQPTTDVLMEDSVEAHLLTETVLGGVCPGGFVTHLCPRHPH